MADFAALALNGKRFSKGWILANYRNLNSDELKENEMATLSFCGRWLSGEEAFSVKTSGSTGPPRVIQLSRGQMKLSAHMTAKALSLQSGDRAFVCLSPQHIGGLMMLVRGLELGLALTVVEPSGNPFRSFGESSKQRFDFIALVPLQLYAILASGKSGLAGLNEMKTILVGGGPLPLQLQEKLEQVRAPVYQTFGMTETASHIALRRLNGVDKSESYQALPEVEVGQDVRGCLTIKSGVTRNERLVTNDMIELASKRDFRWLGRIDNVINSGGMKVHAERVELAVAEILAALGECNELVLFVGGVPDERLGEMVVCVVESVELPARVVAGLRAGLSDKLEKHEVPQRFYSLDKFVRTPTGKINRKLSLERLLAGSPYN